MKRMLIGAALMVGLAFGAGCAQLQQVKDTVAPTPEARIVNGANVNGAAAALGTVLLKNNKITVVQAKSYSAILHTASTHLHDASKTLTACRAATASTPQTKPDPCEPTVAADIALAVSIATDVKKALDSR